MPITIQVTPGLLTEDGARTVCARVAEVLLDVHGLRGNRFMTKNVVGHLGVLPEGSSYVDGESRSLAVVEVKVPSLTFPTREVQQAFVTRVTDLIDSLSRGDHPRARTFVNVTYAVDGTWGIGGTAYTNEDLGAAIAGG